MHYRETYSNSEPYKKQYLKGVEVLIKKLEEEAGKERESYIKGIMEDKEKYRKDFRNMLGWPLTETTQKELPEVFCEKLSEEGQYCVYRMQFEVLENLTVTGLLIKYCDDERRPFVIAQHGALGTPELISGVYGSTANYNDMVERILKVGANVFAPQLLIWSMEEYGVNFDRQMIDARLKKVGSSITAVEIHAIMRVIDYFQVQKWVGNIGMVGLSYGGFYTLFTAAVDTRIKAAISCSFFCEGTHQVRPDWSFQDMEKFWGEAEISCLIHPRRLFLEMGDADELFDCKKSQREYERIREICGNENCDWLEFTIFKGNHEFYKEDDHIRQLVECLRREGVNE